MKKNIIRSFVIGMAAILGLASCSDYMETPSQTSFSQDDFYTSEGNMDRALIGVYGCLKPFSKYYFAMSDLRSDNMFIMVESKKNEYADCSQLNTSGLLNDNIVYSCWSDHYKLIVAANQLIDNIGNVTFSKSTAPVQMEAEARFLRGLSYFDLVRFYGNVPVSLHTITLDESFEIGQSKPKEVYENAILPDFYYAANNLMTQAEDYTGTAKSERVDRIAAKAMLAKAYLQMAGYPVQATSATFTVNGKTITISDLKAEAQKLLADVLDEADMSLPSLNGTNYWAADMDAWNSMFLHENDNKYYLFEIQYAMAADQGNPMTPLTKQQNTKSDAFTSANLTAGPHAYVDRKDIMPYFCQEGWPDKRYYQTINIYGNGEDESGEVIDEANVWSPKFLEHKLKRAKLGMSPMDESVVDRTYWPQNYPIIRLEDVMLLYAECLINGYDASDVNNGKAGALAYVNKIHSRACGSVYDASSTKASIKKFIVNERRYELFCEGQRWFDEVREKTYVDDLKSKWADYAERLGNATYNTYASRVTLNSLYYPIPLSQIRVKDGLYTQNPGY